MSIHQPDDKCPECGSKDVEVGCDVLACLTCKWTLVGETPCETCGEPSTGSWGAGGVVHHHCGEHFPTQDAIFRKMAKAIVAQADSNYVTRGKSPISPLHPSPQTLDSTAGDGSVATHRKTRRDSRERPAIKFHLTVDGHLID